MRQPAALTTEAPPSSSRGPTGAVRDHLRQMKDRCPYCLRLYDESNPATEDHVFLDASGGWATIEACKQCNNQVFGSEVEGGLQRPQTLGAFERHVSGDASRSVRARAAEVPGEIDVNLVEERFRSVKPVVVERSDPTVVRYRFSGSEEQVRALLEQASRKLGLSDEQIEDLVATGVATEIAELSVELTLDLALAARSTAKIALGSLILARGDGAVECELAQGLREIAFGEGEAVTATVPEPVDNAIAEYCAGAGEPLTGNGRTAFVTASEGQTLIVVRLAGSAVPLGVSVAETMPDGDPICTVVEDAPKAIRVIEVGAVMARAADAAATLDDQ